MAHRPKSGPDVWLERFLFRERSPQTETGLISFQFQDFLAQKKWILIFTYIELANSIIGAFVESVTMEL